MTALWWVRRDARLHDNPALLEALSHGAAAAVFPWTPALHWWSGRRRAHLARVLWSLRDATGGALAVRRGDAGEVVAAAALEADAVAVYAAEEFTPAGIAAQDEVRRALAARGRELRLVGSPYAVAPGRASTAAGAGYRVFTPFSRAWRAHGWRAPATRAHADDLAQLESDVSLDFEAAQADVADLLGYPHPFGEAAALEALDLFAQTRMADYADGRDRLDRDGCSGLSVALTFGEIHPRTVLARAAAVGGDGGAAFERQIAWRDFHADVLFREPRALRESLRPVAPESHWATGDEADAAFVAWRDGVTGFPLVDAGMRQLAATGTMHNRARMVAASFLVKDLHLPWQRGATYFRRALLDYDHAQNALNWQWVAGTGRDAAPYFRVFNPSRQAAAFDPSRRYVERWVAEVDTPAYPTPMVDHAAEREVALAAYRSGPARDA